MIKTILIVLALIVVAFVVVVARQPAEFRILRTTSIKAPPAIVFAQVNDLHKWQAWSPWAKLDPMAKNSFEGPGAGTGAIFGWVGNNQVGEGRMTITESQPDTRVCFKLDFLKPFKATHTAEFSFKPVGDQTLVNWSMSGTNNFMFKAVRLFMNCDKMVGDQFEKGLVDLKAISESAGK